MIKLVEKRDGKVVPFDRSRVESAIQAAMLRTEAGVDIELVHRIADSVENTYKDKISVI